MSHLTENQIDELLIGSLEAGEAALLREHAAGCEACAAQLAEIESPLESFKAVTLAWSERRSATLPVRPAAQRAGARWGLGLAWGSVAAAALLGAVIPVLRHERNVRMQEAQNKTARIQGPTQPAVTAPEQTANSTGATDDSANTDVQESAQEIASDNRLLAMVDEELNAPIPAPGSAPQGSGHSRANTQGTIQD